jgi:RWD domain
MGVEEQKEEREVLDSIFPDEITGIATFPPERTHRVRIPERVI